MIRLKTAEQIEKIRECGLISAKLFKYLESVIYPGITTIQINRIADTFIRDHKAIPSFKNYMGYPYSICASVNEEIIHGLPCNRVLKEGDIVGIDVGIQKNGLISDSARTYAVGEVSKEVKTLMEVTERALYKAIGKVKKNAILNEIGETVESVVKPYKYGIVKGYCGHGVGFDNHEEPEVLNYKSNSKFAKRKMEVGLVIAIEPMINMGDEDYFVLEDGWTVVTIDGKYSAHFEHTVAVTENGYDILTILPEDLKVIKEKYGI